MIDTAAFLTTFWVVSCATNICLQKKSSFFNNFDANVWHEKIKCKYISAFNF